MDKNIKFDSCSNGKPKRVVIKIQEDGRLQWLSKEKISLCIEYPDGTDVRVYDGECCNFLGCKWLSIKPANTSLELPKKENAKSKEELKEGVDYIYVPGNSLRVDTKEADPKYKDIIEKAWRDADKTVKSEGFYAYDVVELQKKILKEKYGIEWRHYFDLNPEIIVD